MPQSLTRYETWLRRGGWNRGAAGNWYLPGDHPHLHLGPRFLAYSWREERNGMTQTRSIRMIVDERLAQFTRGLGAIAQDYRDDTDRRDRMTREAREVAVYIFGHAPDDL